MVKSIAIIGMGYIGGSLGLAFKKNIPEALVTGIDKGSILIRAKNVGAIDNGCIYTELNTGLKDVDLVFLTTPIYITKEILPKVSEYVSKKAVVTDTAFTKREIMKSAEEHFTGGATFIGGHPIIKYEQWEIEQADPYLFSNTSYILVPSNQGSIEALEVLKEVVHAIGAREIIMGPEEHDSLYGGLNHMLQLIAMAHVNSVFSHLEDKKRDMAASLAGERFKRFIEELSTPYYIWEDIFNSNYDFIAKSVDRFIDELKNITGKLGSEALIDEYQGVQKYISDIPEPTKGFNRELFHLYITIEDRPGAISQLTALLSSNGFDIRDIELVKIKEGDAATMRISFSTQNIASKAGSFLVKSGYSCRTQYEYEEFNF